MSVIGIFSKSVKVIFPSSTHKFSTKSGQNYFNNDAKLPSMTEYNSQIEKDQQIQYLTVQKRELERYISELTQENEDLSIKMNILIKKNSDLELSNTNPELQLSPYFISLQSQLETCKKQNQVLTKKLQAYKTSINYKDQFSPDDTYGNDKMDYLLNSAEAYFGRSFFNVDTLINYFQSHSIKATRQNKPSVHASGLLIDELQEEKKLRKEAELKVDDLEFQIKQMKIKTESLITKYELENKQISKELQLIENIHQTTKQKNQELKQEIQNSNIDIVSETKLQNKKKKISSLKQKINQMELVISDYSKQIKELEKTIKLQASQIKIEKSSHENTKHQLEVLSNPICSDANVSSLQNRLLKSKNKIYEQTRVISDLNNKLSLKDIENQSKIKELKLHIQRLETEISTAGFLKSKVNRQSQQNVPLTWQICKTPEIPIELEVTLQQIIENSTLSISSRIRVLMKSICHFFQNKQNETAAYSNNLSVSVQKVREVFEEFIPKLCNAVLNTPIPLNNFLTDESYRLAVIRTILDKNKELKRLYSKTPLDVAQFHQQRCEFQVQMDKMRGKVQKLKEERNLLQQRINKQKDGFLENGQTANNAVANYESLVHQLKEKCDQQTKMIKNMQKKSNKM